MVKLYQPLCTRYHKMNTSETYTNIPILNTNDLFKNCFLFGPSPGFSHLLYHWRVSYLLKLI